MSQIQLGKNEGDIFNKIKKIRERAENSELSISLMKTKGQEFKMSQIQLGKKRGGFFDEITNNKK
jgi:hypothetical protein